MKNRLPESWAVQNDGSQLFKDSVIKYLNTTYDAKFSGDDDSYYGYNLKNDATYCIKSCTTFSTLTLDEFITLSKSLYTLKEIREQKMVIRCTLPEQANKIAKASGYKYDWHVGKEHSEGFDVFFLTGEDRWGWESTPNYFKDQYDATETIEFDQVDFQEEGTKVEEIKEIVKKPFNVGDKVKIPTRKTAEKQVPLRNCAVIRDLEYNVIDKQDFLYITKIGTNREYNLGTNKNSCLSTFHIDDLEHYVEPDILLPDNFVIKNCTQGQRLAIRELCTEKDLLGKNSVLELYNQQYPHFKGEFNADKTRIAFNTINDGLLKMSSKHYKELLFPEFVALLDKSKTHYKFNTGDIVYFIGTHKSLVTDIWYRGRIDKISEVTATRLIFRNEDNYDFFETDISNEIQEFRLATPEEIKKWLDENEYTLPKIASYKGEIIKSNDKTLLKWGCRTYDINRVNSLKELGITNFDIDGYHVNKEKLAQIIKAVDFYQRNNFIQGTTL